ncbi:MAG TPA: GNAT family protein [Bacteroidales bacterium]|nr:GNAT family protein [Bacteroidales bacterium]HQH18172.1 GNAT family protein [Bacteroidales bacterium]HQI44695.1 GNAT family protein [Bacteroidales bacterium]
MIGENLSLRALEPEDINLLYQWENNTSIWHLSNTITPFSRHLLEEYILNSHQDIYTVKQLRLMIVLNKSKEAIGCIDLFDFDPTNMRAGMAILISEEQRNKKYGSEVLSLMIDYCFNTLHLHQLYCNILSNNDASLALFKKVKFSVIGIKKEWVRIQNNWVDEYMLQRINNEQK